MPDCKTIDPLITPYVDGEIDIDARRHVDEHVRRCPPCNSRVAAEREVRQLVRGKREELSGDTPSSALRVRCGALNAIKPSGAVSGWRERMKPFAIAAGVVLVVGGAFVYEATERSTRLLAAELTADHVKCFGMNALLGTNPDAAVIEQMMASTFGWEVRVPESREAGLELVGARPCFYGKGKAAHLMYRDHGRPLSVFMLPQFTLPDASASHPDMLGVLGHEAIVWSQNGHTFVMVAREPEQDMARVAAIVQKGLH
jgi:anti-sigma factor RsiW